MDKNTAIHLIEETFSKKFDEDRFTLFIKNLLNDVEPKNNFYSGQYIWDDHKEHINTYKRIGKYIDPDGEALDVLMVEVKSVLKLERARTTLRNFVIKHLSKFEKDYALVAFYSKEDDGADWRFSFIKLEHQSYLDEEKQKVKTRKEFTPAKRYSFLVGEYERAYTAKNQLLPLLQNVSSNPTLEELENAFSIEKVTDEFFTQYKDLYVKLYEHFENDVLIQTALAKANIDTTRFTKKLLGQIVFLYFLQKKGWLGVPKTEHWGKGNKHFIQELFETAKKGNKNFFRDFLQYLFYEALAKERNNENSFYKLFNCRIPFLNGGLFEAEYKWKEANISIPENLFRNAEKNKAGDVGTGVLDVFDRYNFTIKEDEPLDKEVAVDPEMLGKVFENMLDIVERKSKGAFYTPREIVHYMCQESLIHYLDNALNDATASYQPIDSDQLNMFGGNSGKKGQAKLELEHKGKVLVPKTDIETYIRNGHFALEHDQRVANAGKETKDYKYIIPESIRQHADLIDKKLTEIRICDPAIGSGAFPVGLLHELVNAQLVIKPHLSPKYFTDKLKHNGFKGNEENLSESRYVYNLKRHIIQESIYGVDIDASAIDIARLRLWLSLVVDEDDLDPIETLPNLDYKIVCGNSLIGFPENWKSQASNEIEQLKEKFYNETNAEQKKSLKTEIDDKIQKRLDNSKSNFGYPIDFDFKLFFSEVWREKGGFDIVIGNPPYVRVQNIPYEIIDTYKKCFEFAYKRIDVSILFTEKALQLINLKGHFTFISSNQFLTTEYGRKARGYLSQQKTYKKIIDFGSLPVFQNALTYVSIFLGTKLQNKEVLYTEIKNLPFNIPEKFYSIPAKILNEDVWTLANPKTIHINKKIKENTISLNKIAKAWAGIFTGNDKLLLFHKEDAPEYIDTELLKPVLRAQNCERYTYAVPEKLIFYPYKEVDGKTVLIELNEIKTKYPKSYNFIMHNERALKSRKDSRRNMGEKKGWYGLIRFGKLSKFNETKIISPGEVKHNKFTLDNSQSAFSCGRVFSINLESSIINNFTLLAFLNSSIVEYYLHQYASLKAGGYYSYSSTVLDSVPIKIPNKTEVISLITQYLLNHNSYSKDELISKYFDAIIDSVIFELYFPEELRAANKEILKHLGDLKPINDTMSPEEKLAVIQSEFQRLYDPNHPVRNNLETLDSIEEVWIIKEALK